MSFSKILWWTLDAALTAPLRPQRRALEHLRIVLDTKSRKFDKVPAAINFFNSILPGASDRVFQLLCRSSRLPFKFQRFLLLNYGSGSTVFLLECHNQRKVLKILRRSLGKKLEELYALADEFRESHRTAVSWYNREFTMIPPAEFLILNGPILGSGVAAIVQPFIEGAKTDLLNDYSIDQTLALLDKNKDLRQQFLYFADTTLDHFYRGQRCLDFLGKANLLLVRNNGCLNLVIVDTGIFQLEDFKQAFPQKYALLEDRILQLQLLLEFVTQ